MSIYGAREHIFRFSAAPKYATAWTRPAALSCNIPIPIEWDAGGLELNQKIGCFVRFACSGRYRKVVVFHFFVAFVVAQQPATFSDCVQGVSQWWYLLLRLFRA